MRLTMGDNQNFIFNRPFKDAISMKLFSKKETLQMAANKLGALEDIEDELGIDLPTLFNKILITGGCIWVKNRKGINQWHVESLKQRGLDKQWYLTYSNNVRVKIKDYGKTWALTKEELE